MATLQSPFIPAQPSKPSDPNGIAHSTPKADRAAAKTAWVTWVKAYKDYTYRSTGSDPGKFDHTGFTFSDEGGGGAQTFNIAVTSPEGGHYVLSGTDRNGSVSGNNQPVNLNVGDTVNFNVNVGSIHPFYIKTVATTTPGNEVTTPTATNQGAYNGTVSWTPNTAGTYYYICGNHGSMQGQIIVS